MSVVPVQGVLPLNFAEEVQRDTGDAGDQGLTTADIVKCTGLRAHRLAYWDRKGLLKPSLCKAAGKGSERRYSLDDLVQALLIAALDRRKWTLAATRRALETLRGILAEPEAFEVPRLVCHDTSLLILSRSASGIPVILDAGRGGQYVMGIALETLQEEALVQLSRLK